MQIEQKPIILTSFGYHRKNWIYPFESLRDKYEVIYIHFVSREDENDNYTDAKILYYSDFKDAQELISSVNPDIFITMGMASNYYYAIKYVCNKKKIPVVFMEHGLSSKPEDYPIIQAFKRKHNLQMQKVTGSKKRTSNTSFILNTLIKEYALSFFFKISYLNIYRKFKKEYPLNHFIHKELGQPDYFISYSPLNNSVRQKRFNPKKESIIYIGNFEYDKYRKKAEVNDESYIILIDSPLIDNDSHIEIYNQINDWAQKNNLKLKIKLHPLNYNSKWLISNDNIEYVRETDLNNLIKNAQYCVGFYSTLLIPALYFIPTIIIKTFDHSFFKFIIDNDICNIYDYKNLDIDKIQFRNKLASENKEFTENYFDLKEKTSIERLDEAIQKIINKKS